MYDIKNISLKDCVDSKYVKTQRMLYTQDGVEKTWDIVSVHDSVCILLFNKENNSFVIVKQFRPALYLKNNIGFSYELCSGIVDKNKSLEEIATEEVAEECGYRVKDLKRLTSVYSSTGFAASKQTIFYAQVDNSMKFSKGGGVDMENIEVLEVPLTDMKKFIFDETKPKNTSFLFAIQWFFNKVLI